LTEIYKSARANILIYKYIKIYSSKKTMSFVTVIFTRSQEF